MKSLKYLIVFLFLIASTSPVSASEIPNTGLNFTGANFWQESQSLIKGSEVKYIFPEQKWWLQFNDPILAEYIEQALRENQNVKIASARLEESNELVTYTKGKEFPRVSLNAIYYRLKDQSTFKNIFGKNIFILPLIAQYELDFLQKNHSKTKSARKTSDSSQYDYQTVIISLTSEVATSYFNLLKADKLLELNTELLKYQENSLELKQSLFKEGEISYDEVLINEQSISQTKYNIAEIQKLQGLSVHRLCVLMGKPPMEQSCFPRSDFNCISINENFSLGNPANLITRRPDILSAKSKLEKAGIDISVAFKDFFPSFNITGLLGYLSPQINKLFNWNNLDAAIGGNLAQTIFAVGDKSSTYKISKARYKGAVQEYQKAIIIAFQEVENSIRQLNSDFTQYCETDMQVLNSKYLLNLVNSRYQEGESSCLDIISVQQQLINYEQNKINTKANILIDNISLYKALGGGF